MVDAYLASPKFAALAPNSKDKYLPNLMEVRAELGDVHPDDLKPYSLARLRDNLAATPGKANSMLSVIGALYAWGRERGWVTQANPATGIPKLEMGEHDPWPQEALDAFPEAMTPTLARCCMVALYTGQRLGDILAMRRSAVEGNGVWVTQQKTGKELLIPLHSAIRELVTKGTDVVCPKNELGEPYTTHQFHAAWTRARKLKGRPLPPALKTVVIHGLRKNATVNLLEAGCSEAEVSAVTGMSLQMVVHYGKGARQKRLAREAMRKLELYPGTDKS